MPNRIEISIGDPTEYGQSVEVDTLAEAEAIRVQLEEWGFDPYVQDNRPKHTVEDYRPIAGPHEYRPFLRLIEEKILEAEKMIGQREGMWYGTI